MTPTINPKFHALIPPLTPEELAQLETNLLADGCRDPLVTWNGVLLDGHNRFEICNRHKLPFKTTALEFKGEDTACVWIIRNQLGRRNITLASRCELAEKLAEALRPIAKENLSAGGGDRKSSKRKSGSPILAKAIDTREQAAKEAGVSHGSLAAFRYLKENAEPEELEELKRNPNAKLHKVVKTVKERTGKASRQARRTEAAGNTPLNEQIIVGDFREHAAKIINGSLTLIFTDPPYDLQSDLLDDLGKFASNKLADGGSLLCYIGQTKLPLALAAFSKHLRYWWTIACVHSEGRTVMREYGINALWKPVLWFVKTTRNDNSCFVNDVMSGGKEKAGHDWQQSQSEAEYWIEKLCPQDGIVCDPFLGSGTSAAAAKRLNRKWIGYEIDPATAAVASKRLLE